MKNMFEAAKIISGYSRKEAERRYEVCRDRFSDDNTTSKNFDLVMEASMLLQRIMDLAKEDLISEIVSEEPNINTDAWVQVPKGDDMAFWLNKYGLREWTQKLHPSAPELTAVRSYYWCDRIIIMNENRRVINDFKFSEFIENTEFWTPKLPEPGHEIKPQHVND